MTERLLMFSNLLLKYSADKSLGHLRFFVGVQDQVKWLGKLQVGCWSQTSNTSWQAFYCAVIAYWKALVHLMLWLQHGNYPECMMHSYLIWLVFISRPELWKHFSSICPVLLHVILISPPSLLFSVCSSVNSLQCWMLVPPGSFRV